jgi:hypothetical protein
VEPLEGVAELDNTRRLTITIVGDVAGEFARAFEGVDLAAVDKSVELMERHPRLMRRFGDVEIRHAPLILRAIGPDFGARTPAHRSSRAPKSHRSSARTRARARGPDDDRPRLTGALRDGLRHKISDAVAARIAATKVCEDCCLELPRTAFRPARRTCTDCEIDARLARRARARATA